MSGGPFSIVGRRKPIAVDDGRLEGAVMVADQLRQRQHSLHGKSVRPLKPKFHYADFPETSPSGEISAEVGVMEFELKRTSRVCRGLLADVTGKSV